MTKTMIPQNKLTYTDNHLQRQKIQICCCQIQFISFFKFFNIFQLLVSISGLVTSIFLFFSSTHILGPILISAFSILHLSMAVLALVKFLVTDRFTFLLHKIQARSCFILGFLYCILVLLVWVLALLSVFDFGIFEIQKQLNTFYIHAFLGILVPVVVLNFWFAILYLLVISRQTNIEKFRDIESIQVSNNCSIHNARGKN